MAVHYNNRPLDGWVKVFRHYSGNGAYFSSANSWAEAKNTNQTNPTADKFSILDRLENIRVSTNGTLTLKIVYSTLNLTNIWSQTSNPVLSTVGSAGVTGYQPISIQTTSNGWGGLEYDGSSTFLDGTVNSGNWYYAIAPTSSWGGTNMFPGPSAATNLVELWVNIT